MTHRPRILIFSLAYEPVAAGAELAVRYITDRLFSFEFDLITCRFSNTHSKFEKIGNVNVYRVGYGSRIGRYLYPIYAYRKALQLQKTREYQIVWAIMAAYAAAAALLFKRRFPKVQYLLTLQEGDPIEHIHKRVRGFKKIWQQAFARADYIQAISQYLALWAKREGATCPVEVVPNGVDSQKFQISNFKFQNNSNDQISNFKIITVSRLVPKNGIDILIRALAIIARDNPHSNPNVKLQIIGIGSEEAKLKKLTTDLKLENFVEFLGEIDQKNLPKYLVAADIFVRPSRSEGLGTAFLEAAACGLPVIGTKVGGISDFLVDGETGLFCRSDDYHHLAEQITRLIADEALRQELGHNGRRLVEERYAWDKIAVRFDRIIRNLIRSSATLSDAGEGRGEVTSL